MTALLPCRKIYHRERADKFNCLFYHSYHTTSYIYNIQLNSGKYQTTTKLFEEDTNPAMELDLPWRHLLPPQSSLIELCTTAPNYHNCCVSFRSVRPRLLLLTSYVLHTNLITILLLFVAPTVEPYICICSACSFCRYVPLTYDTHFTPTTMLFLHIYLPYPLPHSNQVEAIFASDVVELSLSNRVALGQH